MKQIHAGLRYLFFAGGILSLTAGIQLFLLSEQTEKYFAWTIQSPLTAATFGGFYFGTMVFGFLSGREIIWAHVRGPALALLVFLTVTLIATLLHFDKFHFASQDRLTQLVAWVWLLIYIPLPPTLFVLLILQTRVAGNDPERTGGLAAWIRALLLVRGMAGIAVAFPLFFTPQLIVAYWPWVLTPLTSQVLSAWLISFGVVDLQTAWEDDWHRVRIMNTGYIVFGLLAMIAMGRYASEVKWLSIGTLGYLTYLLSMVSVGVYGWMQASRVNRG